MSKEKFPPGWRVSRVRQLIAHYDALDEDRQVAEDEAAHEQPGQTTVVVPVESHAGHPTDVGGEGWKLTEGPGGNRGCYANSPATSVSTPWTKGCAFAAAQDSIYSGLQVMTAIEHIKAAQQSKLVDEDGDQVSLELLPPLAGEEMASLQERLGQPLPDELRMILTFCSGIDGCLAGVDFTGASMSFAQVEIFPNGLPIAADGFGNYWVLDLTPETTQVAPVFFACHDPPVILYQSADMASFLSEVCRTYTPPHKSLVDDVHEDRLFEVWRRNPGVVDQRSASSAQTACYALSPRGCRNTFRL